MWVLAPSELEQLESRFITSLHDAGSWIAGPDWTGHPLIITGAEMNVAGVGYIEALEPDYPSCTAHPFKIAILSKGPVARGQMAATSERKSPKQ